MSASSFPGVIDEVRIYNKALTKGEIKKLMTRPMVVSKAPDKLPVTWSWLKLERWISAESFGRPWEHVLRASGHSPLSYTGKMIYILRSYREFKNRLLTRISCGLCLILGSISAMAFESVAIPWVVKIVPKVLIRWIRLSFWIVVLSLQQQGVMFGTRN